jgi:hypothetical protein
MAKIGDVLVSKENPNERYLKINGLGEGKTLVLRDGDSISFRTPVDFLNGLAEAGIISREKAEERLAKTPTFVTQIASASKKNIVTNG